MTGYHAEQANMIAKEPTLKQTIEEWFRKFGQKDWNEHPNEPSAWEDLRCNPQTDRSRLSLDLAVSRQLMREYTSILRS